MKNNLTEVVFILDRSGSMMGLESDTIGGYNSLLEKQKEEAGTAIITTVLFDDDYELLHDRISMKAISPMTSKEYFVRGSTALLDAIGKTIEKINNVQKFTLKEAQAKKVLFVIITDGMENSSRKYSSGDIKNMVEKQKEKYGWEFIFIGANIDAIATAESFGIHKERAVNYVSDKEGTVMNYKVINEAVSMIRAQNHISDHWKEEIQSDYSKRKK